MDLHSHYPFSLLKNGILNVYPSLDRNTSTDVLIIGAGITGALVAWHLSRKGFPLIVLDKRHVGMGSTAASTSLVQYEIDTPLTRLQKLVGNANAARSYLLCRNAIDELGTICNQLKQEVGFSKMPSLQFAITKSHARQLKLEAIERRAIGIDVHLLGATEVHQLFHISKPAGILSKDGGQLDAYAMTHALLQQTVSTGNEVYDHSPVTAIKYLKRGVEIEVMNKIKVRARKLVIACGYESGRYLSKRVEQLASTYVIISEPFRIEHFWSENSLIWNTDSPYLYIKVTPDKRIVVGGKDVPFYDPVKRDALIDSKAKQLRKSFMTLFPSLDYKIDFQWAGSFSNTKDGLPFIGSIAERPHTFFALGFGGNGIIFSQIAGKLISNELTGNANHDIDLFSFNR